MVVVRAIPFASISATNLFPFFGVLHIAYKPASGVVLGLSKFARIARCLAARIQTQPAFTVDVLAQLSALLQCAGAAVVVEASHIATDAPLKCTSVAASGCFLNDASSLEQLLCCHLRLNALDAIVSAAKQHTSDDPALLFCSPLDFSFPHTQLADGMVNAVQRLLSLLPAPLPPPGAARAYCLQLTALTRGYGVPAEPLLTSEQRSEQSSEQQPLQRWTVAFTSLCEHHMLPFCGRVCVAVADAPRCDHARVAKVVHRRARRLQVQERLTQEVADDLGVYFGGGVAVWCEAQHLCMMGRGVETPCSTQTSACRGGLPLRHAVDDAC